MKVSVLLVSIIAAMVMAAPPPPWFFNQADQGTADFEDYAESYRDARTRGVNAGNPIYGIHNTPFGPDGAITGTDSEMNVLILLVDFTDNIAQTPAVYFDSMGFAADTFSLANYYAEVSFGDLEIVTVDWPSSTGWQRAPETYEYYVGGNYGWGYYPANSQGMVEDLCELVDPYVDFSLYDNDNDGYVDGVNVMFAGQFDGTPSTIWPHAWSLPGGGVQFDGVTVYSFSVQNEYDNTPGDKSAAVFCHEFGHVMGLPDLYDYDYDSWGIGDWGLMSFGLYNGGTWSPAHLSAWSRVQLGVTSAINITSDNTYEVPAVESSGTVYRLWTNGIGSQEYYLLENRRPIGYDAALPGHGVLIWHIDDNTSGNDNQWYPGYTSNGHYHVALEQADGLWELEKYLDSGDTGDPYPGSAANEHFNNGTVPDSRDYSFQDTYVRVGPVPASEDTISVFMSVSQTLIEGGAGNPDTGIGLAIAGSNPASSVVDFILYHNGGRASVEVFDIHGRKVESILDQDLPAGHLPRSWITDGYANGVYIARFTSGSISTGVRFTLAR